MTKNEIPYCLDYARKINENISNLNCEISVLQECRDALLTEVKTPEMNCVMSELILLETLLNGMNQKLDVLVRGGEAREQVVMEKEGKLYLVDYTSGKKMNVIKMTEKEFHDYVNRRAGHIIYED